MPSKTSYKKAIEQIKEEIGRGYAQSKTKEANDLHKKCLELGARICDEAHKKLNKVMKVDRSVFEPDMTKQETAIVFCGDNYQKKIKVSSLQLGRMTAKHDDMVRREIDRRNVIESALRKELKIIELAINIGKDDEKTPDKLQELWNRAIDYRNMTRGI